MRSAASVRRHSVRNSIGGWPTTSVKGRARDARLARQRLKRPGLGRVVLQEPDCPAGDRVVLGAEPARGIGCLAREVGADGVDQQQVKQPVEDGVLTRVVAQHLVGEQAEDGCPPFVAAKYELWGERVKESSRDLALEVV